MRPGPLANFLMKAGSSFYIAGGYHSFLFNLSTIRLKNTVFLNFILVMLSV